MPATSIKLRIIGVVLSAVIAFPFPGRAERGDPEIRELLKLLHANPVEEIPLERINMKSGVLFCTGDSPAARLNNKAAELMMNEKYPEARELLLEGLGHAALFFPFRYNLGECSLFLDDLRGALLHFNKAKLIVPEYSKTYLRIGYIYQRWDMDSEAVLSFREALRRNIKELSSYILIGDIYFKRNQLEMAKKYYEATLKIQPRYPDGLLGQAKILFREEKFIQSINVIKSIKTDGDYDKALHYYFAEASFRLRDYGTAAREFARLLEFRNDRFFLTNSRSLIEHKLNMSNRFTEK